MISYQSLSWVCLCGCNLQLHHKTHLESQEFILHLYHSILGPIKCFILFVLFIISIKDNLSRQTYLFLPCKGLPSFLVASGGVRPIKVALFHLHGNSRHCRQQTSLGANKKTKLSGRQSYFREQNTMPTREAIYLFCFIFKF